MLFESMEVNGWIKGQRLFNEDVELFVSTSVGPRVLRFGFNGSGRNEFGLLPAADQPPTDAALWHNYGGHRLWHAPEHPQRTYAPDNGLVTDSLDDGWMRFQVHEASTQIEKHLDIRLLGKTSVKVVHRLVNRSVWPLSLAPWALTVMAVGGTAILPLPPRAMHGEATLLPDSRLTLWPYTDLSDPRLTLDSAYVRIQQDPKQRKPFKLGLFPVPWMAYARDGHLFVKLVDVEMAALYPDMGSNAEVFTDAHILELETLGPLLTLVPGEAAVHTETWHLFKGLPAIKTEDDINTYVLPCILEAEARAAVESD